MNEYFFDERKIITVHLAVSTIALDYFKAINVFEAMSIITNKEEIDRELSLLELSLGRMYFSTNSKEPVADYFILKATDEAEFILKVIQENLHYVKILKEPDGLKEELKERIDLYFKNETLGEKL